MKPTLLIFLTLLALGAGTALGAGSARRADTTLSQVIETRATGLSGEVAGGLELLRAQALVYLSYRSGEMNEDDQDALEDDCRGKGERAGPYCLAILHKIQRERTGFSRRERRRRVLRWLGAIRRGDLQALEPATEDELGLALKKVGSLTAVRGLARKVDEKPGCSSAPLLTSLGLFFERGFPKPDSKAASVKLYTRAIKECKLVPSVANAGYRLALLKIWDNDSAGAEAILSEIHDRPEAQDYRLRIAFWRYRIATLQNNGRLQSKMREWLSREYPLSLHGLLVNNPGFEDRDHPILFRSSARSMLNPSVRAAEMLQALGELEASAEVLSPIIDDSLVQPAELSFRLYVAALLSISGDFRKAFPFTASLFRENPMLMTRGTLELLYPKASLEVVRRQSGDLDPFLILSLIRQESAFNTLAKSPTGALGLMQLQPRTAHLLDRRVSKKNLLDPAVNVRVGVKYFHQLLKRYSQDIELALAAYNAGPERISEWLKRYPVTDRLLFLDLLPIRETREYVTSIARNYYWYTRLYGGEGAASAVVRTVAGTATAPVPRFQLLDHP